MFRYSDADWANDSDNRHSTSGNNFLMAGGAVSWINQKHPTVALSTSETEYMHGFRVSYTGNYMVAVFTL